MQYDPDEALKLKNQICFPLYAAARRITGAYTPYLKPLGLTYTQYITFMVLWEQDGLSVSEICSRLCLDSGTVTPLLKKWRPPAGYGGAAAPKTSAACRSSSQRRAGP